MTIETQRLHELARAVKDWNNCTEAWPHEERDGAAVVGHIDDDGNKYPVTEIDTSQYYADEDSAKLAAFYAAANPAAVLALLDELDRLRADKTHVTSMFESTSKMLNDALALAEKHQRQIEELLVIKAAAMNLAKVKGRHNSEIATNKLLEALK